MVSRYHIMCIIVPQQSCSDYKFLPGTLCVVTSSMAIILPSNWVTIDSLWSLNLFSNAWSNVIIDVSSFLSRFSILYDVFSLSAEICESIISNRLMLRFISSVLMRHSITIEYRYATSATSTKSIINHDGGLERKFIIAANQPGNPSVFAMKSISPPFCTEAGMNFLNT